MRTIGLTLVAILILGCASPGRETSAPPSLSPSPSELDAKAASYLGQLSRWSLEPGLWLKECNKVDPDGAATRQIAYDAWVATNRADLARTDELHHTIGNELFPGLKAKGAEPYEALRAKTSMDFFKVFYFMDPAKKTTLCAGYAALPPLDSAQFSTMKTEAFTYLDTWLANRRTR